MLFDHKEFKLEMNVKKIREKFPNIWKFKNTFLNDT